MKMIIRHITDRIKRIIGDESGIVSVWVVLGLATFIIVGGGVYDFTRGSGMRAKLQEAADTGAREAAKGKDDAQVNGVVTMTLADFWTKEGYGSASTVSRSIVRNGDGTIQLQLTSPHPSFIGKYAGLSSSFPVRATSVARTLCVPPAEERRWTPSSEACPAGQIGSHTFEQEEKRDGVCASPTSAPTQTAWSATGAKQNDVNTCAPPCVAPADEVQWGPSVEGACPAGQNGSIWIERQLKRSASCPAATGPYVWGAWTETGTEQVVSNSCVTPPPPCQVPPDQTRWTEVTAACPAGYSGSYSRQLEERQSAYCPSATGSPVWNGWFQTGAMRNDTSQTTCVTDPGDAVYTTPGTYVFTVPAGIFQIGIVAIGGGGGEVDGDVSWAARGGEVLISAAPGQRGGPADPWNPALGNGGCGGIKHGGGCGGVGGGYQAEDIANGQSEYPRYLNFVYRYRASGGGAGGYYASGGDGYYRSHNSPGSQQGNGGGGAGGWIGMGGGGAGLQGTGGQGPGAVARAMILFETYVDHYTILDAVSSDPVTGANACNCPMEEYPATNGGYGGGRAYGQAGGLFGGGGGGYTYDPFNYMNLTVVGGGGGELSWVNVGVAPNQTISLHVGDGGAGGGLIGPGSTGALRIVWGAGRAFPDQNVQGPNW